MADIRINSLPTTAVASSSDDFLALDGTTNGTRKLNAYSPTFGGNLTVNGTGTFGSGPFVLNPASSSQINFFNGATYRGTIGIDGGSTIVVGASAGDYCLRYDGGRLVVSGAGNVLIGGVADNGNKLQITGSISATNNLTVSGGTITGGTSGLSLASGGTNQNITLTPSGTGTNVLNKGLSVLNTIGQFSGTGAPASGAGVEVGMLGTTQGLIFAYNRTTSASLPLSLQHAGGNLLIGTTTDGGQKLQVAGVGIFSSTESAVTLYATASGGIQYQLISGGNLGHALGAFKIVDSSTGYVVLNHDKPTSGGTRLSFDGAGNATFAGNIRLSGTTGTITLGSTNTGTFAVDTNGILTLTGGQSGAKLSVKHGNQGIVFDPIGGSAYVNSSTGNSILQVLTNAVGGTQSILQFAVSGQSTFDIRHDGANLLARDNTAGYYIWKSPQGLTSSTGYFQVLTTTPSSSTTTGALVVSGGVGVAGVVNTGDVIVTQGGTASTPANAFATGAAGTIRWDASYIYICTAANTWKRVAIAAW